MKRVYILLFLILFIIPFGFSQNMKIAGVVYDSTGTIPLNKSLAMAVRMKDSVLLGFTRSNEKGEFQLLNVPIDTFTLFVAYPGYDDRTFFIFGSTENNEINIPSIRMSAKAKQLEEVVIYANKSPIYFRGDTLVYVADSFKVAETAVVEDLLKKLPGVKVDENGKITSQGKEIGQVLVDGDEFFGSDPTIATKNLGAKGVQSVEVYEKKNENATEGGDETIQVMNLKLKEDAKKGYFGRVSGASDFAQFYEGELLLNKFNKAQKISVFALGSNTPKSGFGWGDLNKFGLENEGGNFMNEDGEMVRYSSNDGNGIPQTFKAGVYYSDKIGKRKQTKIGLNYTYNNYRLNSLSSSRSQYFLQDTTYFSDDSTRNLTENESHSVNFSLASQLDSLTFIEFKPKMTYTEGSTEKRDYTSFLSDEEILSRSNTISNLTESKSTNIENEFNLNRKFMKPRRELKTRYYFNYTDNQSDGTLSYTNEYFDPFQPIDSTNQSKVNDNRKMTHTARLTYTEPLSKKIKLELEYNYDRGFNTQLKETRDAVNGNYSAFNDSLSNHFDNLRQENRLSTMFIYESRKHTITAGVRARNVQIENTNLITDTIITQNISNLLPRFIYNYKPSQTKRFRFKYNTNSRQPSINDLQPVRDNSNPNRISIGNPDLKPTYTHAMDISFNTWDALTGKYIWTGANFSLSTNDFGNSTVFDSYGRQISQTINVDGNMWGSLYFGGGIPIYKKIITLEPGIDANYSQYTNYINATKNTTINQSITPKLELSFQFDSLSFSFAGNMSYTDPSSTISNVANQPYTNQQYTAELDWTLPWLKMRFKSDIRYTINGQRAEGYNINYLIWNADLSKTFLKNENLILSLQGNDILNQNIMAQRQINGNIITDNKTKIISRYFLVKLTFKFNNNKTKEEEFNGWRRH